MKVRRVNIVFLYVILIVTLAVSVNGGVWNVHYCQASPASCEAPEVILQSGNASTSTIYTNDTSAKVSVVAPAPVPTYYPSGYNVWSGTHVSGTVPSSVQTVDTDYFVVESASAVFSSTGYTPAFIGYLSNTGTSTLNSPKSRSWNGSEWLTEEELTSAGSAVQYVRVVYCPIQTRWYEKIVVTLSNDGYLDAYVWTGSAWSITNNIGYVGTTVDVYRAYDIAYERSSGEAMLVYAIYSTDTTKDLAYKIWDGTQWSGEAYINDEPTSDIQYYWVKLASYPLTTGRVNEIALIASEETSDDANAWIWDGSSWGNYLQLEGSVASRTRECISVEYEQQSGDAMFIWGYEGGGGMGYGYMESRKWTGSWQSELPQVSLDSSTTPYWFTLKADPVSNRLMAVSVDSAYDFNTIRWDGSSWTRDTQHDSSVDTYSTRCADFEWEPSGSKGLLVWGTSSGSLSYKTFTAPSTWSETSTITASGTHLWVQLRRNTRDVSGDVEILGAMLNSNNDLGGVKWDGSTITNIGDSTFTSDTTTTSYECFDIRFSNYCAETIVSTEFIFSDMTKNTPTQLDFTVVSEYNVTDVKVTIQVWNYSSPSYVTSGEGYLKYTSTSANETKLLSITTNPQFYTSAGNAKINITGVSRLSLAYQQKGNQIKLDYKYGSEENIKDYVDNNTSNEDNSSPDDRGTHSNFAAQQAGPDSNYDTLEEAYTGGFVRSVEMVELNFTTTATEAYTSLSKSQNISNCIPLVTQYIGDGANNYWDEIYTDVYFSGGNVYARRTTSGHTLALSIAVIELDGSNVQVQSGTFMLDNNLSTTVDIGAVNTTKAFIVIHYNTTARASEFGEIFICASFVDSDTIQMERWNNVVYDDSDIQGHWYVVEAQNEEFLVQEAKWTHTAGETSGTRTINEVQMNKTILIATYCQDQGYATYSDESSFRIDLQDSTTIRWVCDYSCDDVTFCVYVIEFQGNEYVQRGTIAMPSGSEVVTQDLSSAVNLTKAIVHGVTFHGQTETDNYGAGSVKARWQG